MKSKREYVAAIAKHVEGDKRDLAYAKDYAVRNNKMDYILDVYQFFTFHPEHAGFCMKKLTGMEFKTKC